MKKYSFLLLILTLCFGCANTIEFNNPAIQANNEGQLWKAVVRSASIKDDGLIIEARRGAQSFFLFTTRTDIGIYPLGGDNQSEARYISEEGVVFSTLNTPDASIQVFPADGLIEITNIDLVSNTATGEFWFNAFTEDGLESINFIDGVFFEVPIRNNIEEITGGTTCQLATADVMLLQAQISSQVPEASFCETFLNALQTQLLACTDDDGAIQQLIDNLDCNDDDMDGIPNAFEDADMDGDFTNDDTDMDGTPNFLDTDDDGDGVLSAEESGDTDGDGILDYLDTDDDGDGILTIFEGPGVLLDTDNDNVLNYLDNDDDGDGIETANENPDPNGDGNPNDAVDTDMNGTPDFLQP